MVLLDISVSAGSFFRPSTAEVMEMGGVMMPSARSAAPPIVAGITSHFFLRLTNAKREKIPPSPLLSALSTSHTYLIVVCKVSVQMINDNVPIISNLVTTLSLMILLNT